jgi:hypothetical protein
MPRSRRRLRAAALGLLLAAAGCITEDAATGRNIPRGHQRYEFAEVEKAAEHLREGLTRSQVLSLLGSAAQVEENGELWVYLPERLGLLIPARSLHVRFKDGVVVEHGYRPIVFGADL